MNSEQRHTITEVLGEPGVVEAFASKVLDHEDAQLASSTWGHVPEQLVAFAEHLLAAARGAATAPLRWLRATCREARGEVLAAERHLAEALRADPDFPPALLDAASYAEDRGEAARALGYLRRAGSTTPKSWSGWLALRGQRRWAATTPAPAGRDASTRRAACASAAGRCRSGPPGCTRRPCGSSCAPAAAPARGPRRRLRQRCR